MCFLNLHFKTVRVMIEAGLQEPTIYVGNLQSPELIIDVRDAVKYYMLVTKNPIGVDIITLVVNILVKLVRCWIIYFTINNR